MGSYNEMVEALENYIELLRNNEFTYNGEPIFEKDKNGASVFPYKEESVDKE